MDGARQADLDTWAAGSPKSTVRADRLFRNWAVRHRLVPADSTNPGPLTRRVVLLPPTPGSGTLPGTCSMTPVSTTITGCRGCLWSSTPSQ